jgi:hypothetical protein
MIKHEDLKPGLWVTHKRTGVTAAIVDLTTYYMGPLHKSKMITNTVYALGGGDVLCVVVKIGSDFIFWDLEYITIATNKKKHLDDLVNNLLNLKIDGTSNHS